MTDAEKLICLLNIAKTHKLNLNHLAILLLIADTHGEIRIGHSADLLHYSYTAATLNTHTLLRAGFITKHRALADGHKKHLHLTPPGYALVHTVKKILSQPNNNITQ